MDLMKALHLRNYSVGMLCKSCGHIISILFSYEGRIKLKECCLLPLQLSWLFLGCEMVWTLEMGLNSFDIRDGVELLIENEKI